MRTFEGLHELISLSTQLGNGYTLRLALMQMCVASDEIGRTIEPWLADAARAESYRRLPRQEHPVVMNTKGASASGKSTRLFGHATP